MTAATELDLKALDVTDAQLARLLDVSARRVRQLAEQGTLERVAPGRFNLAASVAAMIEQAGGNGSEFQRQRTRKMTADATAAELALAKERGEVAPIKEMERAMDVFVGLVRTNMLNIPRRVASTLIGEQSEARLKAVLREEITLVLTEAAAAAINPEEIETEDDA
ncbi:hypothetical protein [Pseudomonas oryzihabitans]|uniref:hypothetical protein n=1 Tax=Pseudomonas oryzihabitans TaxID=47885 RepID=UPI0021DA6B32|nr:hypothetical protein [Pseudomonas oryzihabitans]